MATTVAPASAALAAARQRMVSRDLAGRGIHDRRVLDAMAEVPREAFLSAALAEFAYEDTPLPIEAGQTISQPYIVAAMLQALELKPRDRVLEVGAGSGYAAAVLSRVAAEVDAIERHAELAELAAARLRNLGYANARVHQGDGTLGWPEHSPYDAIVVAAGGPEVPPALLAQLADGGRLVIPVGPDLERQNLVKVERLADGTLRRTALGAVRFVPLVGAGGWSPTGSAATVTAPAPAIVGHADHALHALLRETAEPIHDLEHVDLGGLLERIGDARVVLLGEATHGTSEFYRFRARITRELIARQGFGAVAIEGDWPDAARVDRWARGLTPSHDATPLFSRFPTWMWRNREVSDFLGWLREHNRGIAEPERQVGFHGLDLYSLYASRDAVLRYLDGVDPDAARIARTRYGCLTPWEHDPALYGRAAVSGRYRSCEGAVVATLTDLLARRLDYSRADGERYFDAAQNARLVADAEQYYRVMYYGSRESWNLRDTHMFDTLRALLDFRGPQSRVVVWEHNSHVGNALATDMGARGEINVGALARQAWGNGAYLCGFGTDHGTVAAATDWGGPMEVKRVRPAHADSYERLFHDCGVEAFLLHLRQPRRAAVRDELSPARLERAIGVIYRPETELQSHYFEAALPDQFDEYVWIDRTSAVTPLADRAGAGEAEAFPFDT